MLVVAYVLDATFIDDTKSQPILSRPFSIFEVTFDNDKSESLKESKQSKIVLHFLILIPL